MVLNVYYIGKCRINVRRPHRAEQNWKLILFHICDAMAVSKEKFTGSGGGNSNTKIASQWVRFTENMAKLQFLPGRYPDNANLTVVDKIMQTSYSKLNTLKTLSCFALYWAIYLLYVICTSFRSISHPISVLRIIRPKRLFKISLLIIVYIHLC